MYLFATEVHDGWGIIVTEVHDGWGITATEVHDTIPKPLECSHTDTVAF